MIEFGTKIQNVMQSEKAKEKAKVIGIPTVLSAGIAFHATKNAISVDSVTLGSRLKTAGKAGLLTAAIMTIATMNKDSLKGIGEKIKGFVNKGKDKNEGQSVQPEIQQTPENQESQLMPTPNMQLSAQKIPSMGIAESETAPDTIAANQPMNDIASLQMQPMNTQEICADCEATEEKQQIPNNSVLVSDGTSTPLTHATTQGFYDNPMESEEDIVKAPIQTQTQETTAPAQSSLLSNYINAANTQQ